MLYNLNLLRSGYASLMRLKRIPFCLKIQLVTCICFVGYRGEQYLEFDNKLNQK